MTELQKKQCTELWMENERTMVIICKSKLSNQQDIEEVISETFLALCAKVVKSGLPEYPKAWLYGTLKNKINEKYREMYKNSEKVQLVQTSEIESMADSSNLEDNAINGGLLADLNTHLQTDLAESDKQLAKYVFVEGRPYKEIADMMGLSEPVVKQRKFRLCHKIKRTARLKSSFY